jgi:hypothetical protein
VSHSRGTLGLHAIRELKRAEGSAKHLSSVRVREGSDEGADALASCLHVSRRILGFESGKESFSINPLRSE